MPPFNRLTYFQTRPHVTIWIKNGTVELYRERLTGARGFTSSPWAGAGKVFCLDENAQTFVVQAGPEFKLLGKNSLNEMCWSSPAVAGDAIFLRTVDRLYCIQQSKGDK